MSNGGLIDITGFLSTYVMTVPVGPFPRGGQIPDPNPNQPYDILYICTGLLIFEFHHNNGEITGILTTHGPTERAAVPIMTDDGVTPLRLVSPRSGQLMKILDSAISVSLARINNIDSDNGIWTVDEAAVLDPLPGTDIPELSIQLKVRGDEGIKLERVSYTAFIQTSPVT